MLFISRQLLDADIDWLAKNGRREKFPARSVLIREGVPVETLYILLDGELTVVRGDNNERVLARLGAGEIVGEMSLIESRASSATVLAETDVVVCAISKPRLHAGARFDDLRRQPLDA